MSAPLPVPSLTTSTHPSKLHFASLPPKFDNDEIKRCPGDSSRKSLTTEERSKSSDTLSHTAGGTLTASSLVAPTPPKTASPSPCDLSDLDVDEIQTDRHDDLPAVEFDAGHIDSNVLYDNEVNNTLF